MIPDSALRNIIEFAGGPLGAPVFMFSMGIDMMYTRHNSPGIVSTKESLGSVWQ